VNALKNVLAGGEWRRGDRLHRRRRRGLKGGRLIAAGSVVGAGESRRP
jgi:hypothetical protein